MALEFRSAIDVEQSQVFQMDSCPVSKKKKILSYLFAKKNIQRHYQRLVNETLSLRIE